MNFIACVKQVPDPEIPPGKIKLDLEAKRIIFPEGIRPLINPYDERAVELALRLKEKYGGKITILTLGSTGSVSVVKHAISMGADDGILLVDPAFEDSDSFGTAHILTKAIEKMGNYDLILCGRQAADWDEGIVGPIIAENLRLPLVTLVESIEIADKKLKVKRVTLDGYQVFETTLPSMVTVSHEVGRPRLPSGRGIILATRKQVPVWNAKDIGADPSQLGLKAARRKLIKLFIPDRERKCQLIGGETPVEAATKLAVKLREVGVI